MSLIERLEAELKEAMAAREAARRDTLRLILASLRSAEKELQRPLHDDEELQVLQRERKKRAEAADAFREGEHVNAAEGFVAIRDINPKAETHLLVIPERHVDTFREVAQFPPDEAQRMLAFVADTARGAGLEDYRVVVNVGAGGGQTIFHLHWHVLGGHVSGMPA